MSRLAIVGGGPNCTYAVERLAALAPLHPASAPLHIAIFDRTGVFGAGAVHDPRQSRTNYLNRVASQIGFAADESIAAANELLPAELRPAFPEWLRRKRCGEGMLDLSPTDVPRRYLHGEALADAFDRDLGELRRVPGFSVDCHADEVVDVAPAGDGFTLHCRRGSRHQADFLLLATGHGDNVPDPRSGLGANPGYVAQAYPVEAMLCEGRIPPKAVVGIAGMGLTAIDAILQLTEGRGGTFEERRQGPAGAAALDYRPSGREPARIVPFCPSGLFIFCRGLNQKAVDPTGAEHGANEHRGHFLTDQAVDQLRAARGAPGRAGGEDVLQLDFERDLFPLVLLEMALVFHSTAAPELGDRLRQAAIERYRRFLAGECPRAEEAAGDWLIEPLDEAARLAGRARFHWRSLFNPLDEKVTSPLDWAEQLTSFIKADLEAGAQGNLTNPRKAAIDAVWRDLRGVLARAVDFGGLTPASHRYFIARRLRDYNRQSNGAGLEPMKKLLALVEAGIVDASVGPRPALRSDNGALVVDGPVTGAAVRLDFLVEGRAHPFDSGRDANPLYRNLIRRGLARLWLNEGDGSGEAFAPGAIDVTQRRHPRNRQGKEDERITILGAPVERTAFFQLTAARPYSGSQPLKIADRWARELLGMLAPAEETHDCIA